MGLLLTWSPLWGTGALFFRLGGIMGLCSVCVEWRFKREWVAVMSISLSVGLRQPFRDNHSHHSQPAGDKNLNCSQLYCNIATLNISLLVCCCLFICLFDLGQKAIAENVLINIRMSKHRCEDSWENIFYHYRFKHCAATWRDVQIFGMLKKKKISSKPSIWMKISTDTISPEPIKKK